MGWREMKRQREGDPAKANVMSAGISEREGSSHTLEMGTLGSPFLCI